MKKTLLFRIIPVLLAALLLAGCTAGGDSADEKANADLMAGIQAAGWPAASDTQDPAFRTSLLNFSWKLFGQTLGEEGNTLVSPPSVYLALAMTLNGAKGDTLTALQEALSAEDMTVEELNDACRNFIGLMGYETEKTKLTTANSIWFRQDYDVAGDFLQTNADYFNAAARALDFSSQEAVDVINGWVSDQTRGAIGEIVDEIREDTMMYLINAVYFKAEWQTPFEANDTQDGEFAAPGGAKTVPFMNRTGEMSYVDADGVQGVMLPYDDGRFSFFALMPEEGQDVREYIGSLDGEAVAALLASMETGAVALSLPKFETRWEDSLVNALSAMGMGIAFTDAADFSPMNSRGSDELCIGDVLHKTFCRVDEKGTEAAAVTSVEIQLTAMPMYDATLCFNRPFVYGIVDTASAAPLFLGVMTDPAQ